MSISEDLQNTGLTARIGLIVYLKNISDQYKLRRFGDIVYFSKKMGYCVIYVDNKEKENIKNQILSLDFVERVKYSEDEKVDLDNKHIEMQIHKLAQEAEDKLLHKQVENEDGFH